MDGVSRCAVLSLTQYGWRQGSARGPETHSAEAAGSEVGPAASDGMQEMLPPGGAGNGTSMDLTTAIP